MNSKKSIIRYIEVFFDVVVMFTSYLIANRIKFGFFRTGLINRTEHYLTLFLLEFAAYVVVYFVVFRNENIVNRDLWKEIFTVMKMYAYIVAITAGCIYFTKMGEVYSRAQITITFALSPILTIAERQIIKRIVTKEYHRSGANEKIMLITTADQVEKVVKKIKSTRNWDFRISNIAIIDENMIGKFVDKIEVVASKSNLYDFISTAEIDSAFVHLPNNFNFDQRKFVTELNEMGKTVYLNINEYEMKIGERRLDFLGKYAVVTWKNRTYRIRYVVAKKIFDILLGVIGCVVTVPVWIMAFIGKLVTGDHGPVIISIVRVGKNGRRFYYHKFRTMRLDAVEQCDKWIINGKQGKDPRYTAVGRLLKRTRLENLPSSWNVLWGDMSIVGNPAPSLTEFLDYSVFHRKSLSIKPGVIGYWQVYAKWEKRLSEEIQSELDQEYIQNCSFIGDLRIILKRIFLFWKTTSKRKFVEANQEHDEMHCMYTMQMDMMPLEYDKNAYYKKANAKSRVYMVVKRATDIIVSAIAIVLLSPLFLILSVVVKMGDGASVFYGHTRIGYKGKKISVYKFRSMKADAGELEKILTPKQLEQYRHEFKIDDDPRITKIGNLLRKTSLDELPQLFNVLKGDMSIVGPRPIVEKETKIYGKDIAKLLSVKPGLTGYWQAYARNNASYESGERQRMEMYYIDNRSLWLDIKIIIKTFVSVLRGSGAQ